MIPLTGNVRTGSDQQPKIATAIKSSLSCTAVTPLHHSAMNVNLAVRSFVGRECESDSAPDLQPKIRTHAPTTKTPPQLLPSEHICSVVEVARELQTRQKETSTNQSQQCREALSGVHACIAFSPRYNAARSNVSTTFAMAGQTSFPNVSQSHS